MTIIKWIIKRNNGFIPLSLAVFIPALIAVISGIWYFKSINSPETTAKIPKEEIKNEEKPEKSDPIAEENNKLKEDLKKSQESLNILKQDLQVNKNKITLLESSIKQKDTEISSLKKENDKTKSKIDDLNTKVNCQELIKKTPEGGIVGSIGVDIEKYYNVTLKRIEEIKANPSSVSDYDEEIKFYEGKLAEAKPMYDNYRKKCK